MNRLRRINVTVLLCIMGSVWLTCPTFSQPAPPPPGPEAQASAPERDGQHDFDFEFGTWRSHISQRLHPLTGSTTWVQLEATVVVRQVWNGRANLMELVADSPTGHLEELDMRLYNPQSHQWSRNFANSSEGKIEPTMLGEFKNGRGEFIGQDTLNGKAILVRHVFSEITPDSHHLNNHSRTTEARRGSLTLSRR